LRKERPFGEEVVMGAQYVPHTPLWRKFLSLPHTRLGWWAVGLAAGSVLLLIFIVNFGGDVFGGLPSDFLILFALGVMLAGVVGGVVGLIAVLLSYERSVLVWLTMVVAVPYIGFLLFAMGAIFQYYTRIS
jgi:hypothetical protein